MTPADAFVWSFLSDRVMGGVSEGSASMRSGIVRLWGRVSTANRGGFIQVRTELAERLPHSAEGIAIRVRGIPGLYYLHLRTDLNARPWQFHQATFEARDDWEVVRVPFSAFAPRGGAQETFAADDVRSIGIAAYGRDHDASVSISALGLY